MDGQWVDYSRPQENGNKTGVRWISLTDNAGDGLLITAQAGFLSASARYYSKQTMEDSAYSFQMQRSKDIYLNIDAQQGGVGGINSWGAAPLTQYQLNQATYSYSYYLQPIASKP